MASKEKEIFDTHLNVRVYQDDLDEFYAACRKNGEPDGAKVIRRMMGDYVDGNISYNVKQQD